MPTQLTAAIARNETDSVTDGHTDLGSRVELGDAVPGITNLEHYPITVAGGPRWKPWLRS